jgi:hypothetical protein
VMLSPLPVSRVMPPMATMHEISTQPVSSQITTGLLVPSIVQRRETIRARLARVMEQPRGSVVQKKEKPPVGTPEAAHPQNDH